MRRFPLFTTLILLTATLAGASVLTRCSSADDCSAANHEVCARSSLCQCAGGYVSVSGVCYPSACVTVAHGLAVICGGPGVGVCSFSTGGCVCKTWAVSVGGTCIHPDCIDETGVVCGNAGTCVAEGESAVCECDTVHSGSTCQFCKDVIDSFGRCVSSECAEYNEEQGEYVTCSGKGVCLYTVQAPASLRDESPRSEVAEPPAAAALYQNVNFAYSCFCTAAGHLAVGPRCLPKSCLLSTARGLVECADHGVCTGSGCVCDSELYVGPSCSQCSSEAARMVDSCGFVTCVPLACVDEGMICSGVGTCVLGSEEDDSSSAGQPRPSGGEPDEDFIDAYCSCPGGYISVGPRCADAPQSTTYQFMLVACISVGGGLGFLIFIVLVILGVMLSRKPRQQAMQ